MLVVQTDDYSTRQWRQQEVLRAKEPRLRDHPEQAPGPLRRRLSEIKKETSKTKPLPVKLLMASHIDADHIAGVLEMTAELAERNADNKPLPYAIQGLWHNSCNDILEDGADELFKTVEGKAKAASSKSSARRGTRRSRGSRTRASSTSTRRRSGTTRRPTTYRASSSIIVLAEWRGPLPR